VETDHAGRWRVGPDLAVPGHPQVFVLGDLAAAKNAEGSNVPGVAPAAMQMGRYVARLLEAETRDPRLASERTPFVYRDKGIMATIGRNKAVARLGADGPHLTGWLAWQAWLTIHLLFLVGLRNKITVFINWIYSYLTYRNGARVIYGHASGPPRES
jgi:NADH dehydrogenase